MKVRLVAISMGLSISTICARAADKSEKDTSAAPSSKTAEVSAPAASEPGKELSLGISFGYGSLSRKGQDWRGSGASDIKMTYQTLYRLFGGSVYATLGYTAFDVVATSQAEDEGKEYFYRGSIERYGAAMGVSYSRWKRFMLRTDLGLGINQVYLRQVPPYVDGGEEGTKYQVALTWNGSLMMKLGDKLAIGPAVGFSQSTVTTRQLSFITDFIF